MWKVEILFLLDTSRVFKEKFQFRNGIPVRDDTNDRVRSRDATRRFKIARSQATRKRDDLPPLSTPVTSVALDRTLDTRLAPVGCEEVGPGGPSGGT